MSSLFAGMQRHLTPRLRCPLERSPHFLPRKESREILLFSSSPPFTVPAPLQSQECSCPSAQSQGGPSSPPRGTVTPERVHPQGLPLCAPAGGGLGRRCSCGECTNSRVSKPWISGQRSVRGPLGVENVQNSGRGNSVGHTHTAMCTPLNAPLSWTWGGPTPISMLRAVRLDRASGPAWHPAAPREVLLGDAKHSEGFYTDQRRSAALGRRRRNCRLRPTSRQMNLRQGTSDRPGSSRRDRPSQQNTTNLKHHGKSQDNANLLGKPWPRGTKPRTGGCKTF